MASFLYLFLCLLSCFEPANAGSIPNRLTLYTLPYANPPPLDVAVNNLDTTDAGLIFLTPLDSGNDGLYIYRTNGELVWVHTPHPDVPWGPANLHPIEYNGEVQLAASLLPYRARSFCRVTEPNYPLNTPTVSQYGIDVVYNNRYEISKIFEAPTGSFMGGHEFYTLDNGSIIVQQYLGNRSMSSDRPVDIDWTVHVFESTTGNTIFEWRALDFLAFDPPCRIFKGALNPHTNSIDRAEDGNWVINNLGMCCTVKVDTTTGAIIWRFGGPKTDFQMTDGTTFANMHDVRVRSLDEIRLPPNIQRERLSSETHTAISFFDNAWDLATPATSSSSSAVVVLLDLRDMTGQVVERYWHPEAKYNPIFGSFHFLPNGNRLVGWGQSGQLSEYDGNGKLMYHAGLGLTGEPMMSYRAYKAPWSAFPATVPDVLSYSWSCISPTVVHVSWNGATDVTAYRVSVADDKDGPFSTSTMTKKNGFETAIWLDRFVPYVTVEALGFDGGVLGRSLVTEVKVPSVFHRDHCMRDGCSRMSPGWGENDGTEECLRELSSKQMLLQDQS